MFVTFLELYVELVERCAFTFLNTKNLIGWSQEFFNQVFINIFVPTVLNGFLLGWLLFERDCLTSFLVEEP